MYVHRAPKYMKQELKGETGKSTITVEDFNIPFSVIDRMSG